MSNPILSVREISKSFPGGVIALDNVSIDIYGGEFTAILGENGAGKSTLVKILYGIYTPDSGKIILEGKPVTIENPLDAIKKGIVMVSQIPQLIDRLSVSENIALSLSRVGLLASMKSVNRVFEDIATKIGVKIDPNAKTWTLSYTQKQLVEIVRAMLADAKVLLLDEALTYLPLEERRKFYEYLKEFKEKGKAIVFITHKIPEALEIADRIYVLRRGRLAGSLTAKEATLDAVRLLMFAEASKSIIYERFSPPMDSVIDRVILDVRDLLVLGDYGEPAVNGVSIQVRAGEIAGIAGVTGNGQRELVEAIVGLRRVEKGSVVVDGLDITNKGVKATREIGIGFIPDQPLRFAVSTDNTVLENMTALFSRREFTLNWSKYRDLAIKLINEYGIYPPDPNIDVKILSGGNMMKTVVSRELSYATKALVAYNPTRGLDEVTACMVRRKMKERASQDKLAILFASEDLDEILQLSDTVYVMNKGRLYGPFDPEKTPRSDIEHLMVI